MADKEFFQSVMLLRKVCRGILRSVCLPARQCRARAPEWAHFSILRKFGHPTGTAPDVAGGLGVGEKKLVFVGECWDDRDGAYLCTGTRKDWVWELRTGTSGLRVSNSDFAKSQHIYSELSASLSITRFRSLPTPCRESAGIWGYGRAPKRAGGSVLGHQRNR